MVQCTSTHLTSFAVLVDVRGVQVGIAIPIVFVLCKFNLICINNVVYVSILQINTKALSVVSYIGLALSMVCLLATIIFFISFGYE